MRMDHIESTNAWTWADLSALTTVRRDQPSYHLFSQPLLRSEVFNFRRGQRLGPITLGGSLLLTGLAGTIAVTVNGDTRRLGPLCQMLVNSGARVATLADSDATVQLLWSPPFSPAHPG